MKRNESGQILPMMGVLVVILVGFIAMGVDLGQGYLQRRVNQNGADAASVAGEKALLAGVTSTNVANTIQHVLTANGFSSAALTWLTAAAPSPGTDTSKVYVDAEYGSYLSGSSSCTPLTSSQYVKSDAGTPPSGASCVKVMLATSKQTFFSKVPILGFAQIGARGTSASGQVPMNGTGEASTIPITGLVCTNTGGGQVTFSFGSTGSVPALGSTISVSGVTPSSYNGVYTVTAVTSTSITVSFTSGCPGAYNNGGVISFTANSPSPTPTPTAGPWDSGSGEGYAIWGGQRADNMLLSVGSTALFFADSGWDTGNDAQTNCNPCEYDATQNFKGYADSQCFVLPLSTTCTGPNGAVGNAGLNVPTGTIMQIVVDSSISHHGSTNTMVRIGLVTIQVLASCPSSPSYYSSATHGRCGTILHIDAGKLNESDSATPTPTATPTAAPVIGNTN